MQLMQQQKWPLHALLHSYACFLIASVVAQARCVLLWTPHRMLHHFHTHSI